MIDKNEYDIESEEDESKEDYYESEETYISKPIFRENVSLKLKALGIHVPEYVINEQNHVIKSIEEIDDHKIMDYDCMLKDVKFIDRFLKQNVLRSYSAGVTNRFSNLIFPYSTKMLHLHDEFEDRGLVVYIPKDCMIDLLPSKLTFREQLYSNQYTKLIVLNNTDLLPLLAENFHVNKTVIECTWLLLPEETDDKTLLKLLPKNTVFKVLFRNKKVSESLLIKWYKDSLEMIEEADKIFKQNKKCLVAIQDDDLHELNYLYVAKITCKAYTYRIIDFLDWISKITSNNKLSNTITKLLFDKKYLFTENEYKSHRYSEIVEYLQNNRHTYKFKDLEMLKDKYKLDRLIVLDELEGMFSKHYINGIY